MLIALTREVPSSIGRCELTHVAREPIDVVRARAEHSAYERALEALGCTVRRLPSEPELPDSVFVEDTALVLDEVAVITRPGAESRRGETAGVAAALQEHRPVLRLEAPATLDGGDVLRIGAEIRVGLSGRSNAEGVRQMKALLEPFGYRVRGVELSGCLHLKTAVTHIGGRAVLANPRWIDVRQLGDVEVVEVDPGEPMGGNAVLVGESLIYPAEFPRTRERLEARGVGVRTVPAGELAKAEGGVTCCSLIFTADETA